MLLPARSSLYALLGLFAFAPLAPAQIARSSQARIIAGTAVHVRSAPTIDAPILDTLRLGSTVAVPLEGQPPDTLWVRVRPPSGIDGYIRADLTRIIPLGGRVAAIDAIASERAGRRGETVAQKIELFDLLTRTRYEPTDDERAGRLALLWLRTIQSLLATTPPVRDSAMHNGWLYRSQSDDLTDYDFSRGRHFMRSEILRELHDKHLETASSDEIGWMLHESSLREKCEGYAPCYFTWLAGVDAEYLREHPEGRHAPEMLQRIMRVTREAARTPTSADFFDASRDCTELLAATTALRAATEGTSGTERDAALAALATLARRCEPRS